MTEFSLLETAAEYLIDEKVGVVKFVEEVPRDPGAPNFFHFAGKACDTSAFTRQKNFFDTGGASTTREGAAAKALGEAVERYCSAIYDVSALPLCAFQDADFPCVDPSAFALYSEAQYAQPGFLWVPFDRGTPVRWTQMTELASNTAISVPAARVYMPYTYYRGAGDSPIDQPISTGLACHGNFDAAALTGLCEVVERDAISICWQARLAMPQIRAETLDDANYDMLRRFEVADSEVTLIDITMDHGIPTVLSVLRGRSANSPGLVVAAASSPNPSVSVRKSLEELAHTRRYCQFVASQMPRMVADPPDFLSVHDQLTHLNFYVDRDNAHHADFLFGSKVRKDFRDIVDISTGSGARDLQVVADRISGVGEMPLVKDLTTADVAACGLTVVRAVVPGFQQIHMGHLNRCLGGKRLWSVPQQLGYAGISGTAGDNPAPHPYP